VKGECNLWRRRVSLKQPSTDQRVSGSLLSAQTRSIDPTIGHLRSRCEAEKGGRPCALRAERLHELDIESNSDLVSNEDSAGLEGSVPGQAEVLPIDLCGHRNRNSGEGCCFPRLLRRRSRSLLYGVADLGPSSHFFRLTIGLRSRSCPPIPSPPRK
jgi:hypothetical protein